MMSYGWEKLFSERMCQAYRAERNVPTVIGRLHGIYGPKDFREAGKDHVIQSLCTKVAEAKLSGKKEICIWGDGSQTRSFLYITDALEGIYKLTNASVPGPVNLANSQVVSVNEVVDLLEEIAGVKLERFYGTTAPTGRQHKTSDNTLLRKTLNWEPMTPIKDGLSLTFAAVWNKLALAKI
jgi:nucleoside-diphosphate-sugar epimerase